MTEIVIVGSGGLAAEITACFDKISTEKHDDIKIIGYVDYSSAISKHWKRYNFDSPVLNDIENYKVAGKEYFVIGMSDIKVRNYMINKINEKEGNFINLIHPTAIVPNNTNFGIGNFIGPFCYIGPNVNIGNYNTILAYSVISHDCIVGDNNVIASSMLCGHVKIANDNFLGARSTLIPRVSIGSRNTIQAGMLVDSDVSNDSVVFYRAKEKILVIPKETKTG